IMEPFGAQGMVINVVDADREWVAGHAGFPLEAVKQMHGSTVDLHTPDTAALVTRTPLFVTSREKLHALYPHIADDGMQAWAFLPISNRERGVGVCVVGFAHSRRFAPQEQAVAMMLVNLLGSALDRARLTESEHQLAVALKQRLLPRVLAEVPEVVTTARYVPGPSHEGVGSSWYDVIVLPGRKVGLVVGEVHGHSIESSMAMAQVRSAVRAYATEGHDPAGVLARTSGLLADLDPDLTADCCFVCLDVAGGSAEIALAGDPVPLARAPDGTLTSPCATSGPMLGAHGDCTYRTTEVTLEPGSVLVLCTDELVTSQRESPTDDIHTIVEDASPAFKAFPEGFADQLIDGVREEANRQGDIVLLLARYEGPRLGPKRHIGHTDIKRHDLHGVQIARHFIREQLHSWGFDAVADELELMASEVVTNALIHADSSVDLRLREYPDHLRLEVRDADPTPPVPAPIMASEEANQTSEHGRGLIIVDGLATQWGNSPSGRGKTVWLEVAI
ncbi:ATP-binding SpoIIE family protein phosphatase, partial [Streptomyces puniciscabiei]